MVGLSWPLWFDDPGFPRVPFVRGLRAPPSWLVLGGIVAPLALAAAGLAWRWMLGVGLAFLGFAVLRDQDRFQPWAYQFGVIALMMVAASRPRALRLARWYVIGLYAYSGLSKFDASFCRELGPTFLTAALGPLGLRPEGWADPARTLACLGMPVFEIGVAGLLAVPSTRKAGLAGAVAQHLALIGILGPWGLGHSTIVLAWNAALVVEDLLLFGRSESSGGPEAGTIAGRFAVLAFALAMILPAGERIGLCDAWPAHALYASHAERSDIYLHEDDLDRYPEAIRRHLGPSGLTPWRRLDLTGWSRAARGAPPYPSGRVGNAIAEFLEARHAGRQPVRLVQWGRARALDGDRVRDESLGLAAIRRRGDWFVINAHPEGADPP